uniref:Uncharacterized protein n=1 Tax=Rhizophora mucronata TaxID=61149 RepID=A0A2P2IQB6_RHIMU
MKVEREMSKNFLDWKEANRR